MTTLGQRLPHFIHLTRLHKPEGTILLLWPALWGLWLAADGLPDIRLLVIFIAGAFVMRAAGCVINDFADRHIDAHVRRTSYRPIATGKIRPWEALTLFAVLSLIGLGLVLLTNTLTLQMACIGAVIIAVYPFMKRYTHLPQVVLGLAWGWTIPMAFAAQANELPPPLWTLVVGVLTWTMVFDTFYAMVDRDDDLKIGVKSTAILFGEQDLPIIAILQGMTVLAFILTGASFSLGGWYFLSVGGVAALFIYQLAIARHRDRDACFRAFLNNRWVGVTLFAGLVLDYHLPWP
jgi:4-hydroxybenzoate polyprenyltransferase